MDKPTSTEFTGLDLPTDTKHILEKRGILTLFELLSHTWHDLKTGGENKSFQLSEEQMHEIELALAAKGMVLPDSKFSELLNIYLHSRRRNP